jgi:glycosyltransferase involved in cell wall biosynthesis
VRPLVFNGKFYSGALNGVHRVADRLIREVDRLLVAMPPEQRPAVRLLLPTRRSWTPDVQAITLDEQGWGHRQIWEQAVLPLRARGAVLVNLCNLAPILARRKVLLLHDAQFLFPDNSYPARQRWGHRLLVPAMMRSSAAALTVSHYSRQIIDLTGICARDRVGILHNGSDHILETPAAAGVLERWELTGQPYVLLFGSTKLYKNVRVVFDAFRSAELAGITLVVVGQGEAAHVAAGFAPPPAALFTGSIDDGTLRTLYEHAVCLAMPSRTEGFGLPPLEAMRLGCPALVAPAGAMPEVCRDAASYADTDDPADWVRGILKLAHDAAHRRAKVAAGLRRAEDFTWARAGALLLDRMMELASS